MASKSQRKATKTHRRRAAARGLVRVENQAPKQDVGLIRALAETLRSRPEKANAVRSTLADSGSRAAHQSSQGKAGTRFQARLNGTTLSLGFSLQNKASSSASTSMPVNNDSSR